MQIIIGDRGSGKTGELITLAAAEHKRGVTSFILCHNKDSAKYTNAKIRANGVESKVTAITLDMLEETMSGVAGEARFYIDNVELFLPRLFNRYPGSVIGGIALTVNQKNEYTVTTGNPADGLVLLTEDIQIFTNGDRKTVKLD